MRRGIALGAMVLAVGLVATGQSMYAFYYDLSGGQDLEINLINTMPWPTDVQIVVYDAYGGMIWSTEAELIGYGPGYVRLGEALPADPHHWGVVTVESSDRLIVGLEYYRDGLLVSVDTVYNELPLLDEGETFWLGTYYTQVGSADTAYIVMNPWPRTARCTVSVYDGNGDRLTARDFVLSPHEAEYVALANEVGSGSTVWGFLDVSMEEVSVIVALEYSGRGCSGLEIDNVTEFYF